MIASAADALRRLLRLQVPGWLRATFGLGILAIVLWFVLVRANATWLDLRSVWQATNLVLLTVAGLAWVAAFFLMAILWFLLMAALGGGMGFGTALKIYGASLLPRYLPGQWWGYAGRVILCKREGVPPSVTSLSILLEAALLAGGALLVAAAPRVGTVIVVTLVIFIVLLASTLLTSRPWTSRLPLAVASRPRSSMFGHWCLLITGYLLFWLLSGVCNGLVVLSVNAFLPADAILQVIPAAAAAWLAGFIVLLAPAGLGVREGVLIVALQPILDPTSAAFAAVLTRLVGTLAELAFSFIAVVLLPRLGSHTKKNAGSESTTTQETAKDSPNVVLP